MARVRDDAAGKSTSSYQPIPGHWDETFVRAGLPRRHWRGLSAALGRLGPAELGRRAQAGRQLIQATGITYNVYDNARSSERSRSSSAGLRPWQMDPIPLILHDSEWVRIAAAVSQRARLMNLLLADLYGERRLLRERLLPTALVYANPQFIRSLDGIRPTSGVFLHLYAADLARSPDGNWRVISDRAQAPSGLGYALENRLVSARILPSVFNQCRVRSLASFFTRQRDSLLALAPQGSGSSQQSTPRAVLLTPGPGNETYFEHSFLARQLGFPLVEGADLTVRDRRVYLKTLDGLEPVDLILRRLDDSFADPLELRGDSLLGVAGLVQAVRAGNVTVANALGSGAVECPALMPFLPILSKVLLGEELKISSPETWWCGHADSLAYVLDHLEELVIKPSFPSPASRAGQQAIFPEMLTLVERTSLRQRIKAQPEQFTAQEHIALSTAPVLQEESGDGNDGATITPRNILLRTFASVHAHPQGGADYDILPGGLTRLSAVNSSPIVSIQTGGSSKDTWVLGGVLGTSAYPPQPLNQSTASAPQEGASMELHPPPARPSGIPSRMADNLFWLGRYTERAESSMRLIRALLPTLSGEEDFGRAATMETTIHLLGALHLLPPEFTGLSLAHQRWRLHTVLTALITDSSSPSGLAVHLQQVRRVSWPLKERLSQDTWRVLEQLDDEFRRPPFNPGFQGVDTHLNALLDAQMTQLDRGILTLSAFAGLLNENTTRSHGWRFLDLGRRFERAFGMLDLLRAAFVRLESKEAHMLELLLETADSSITYRSRYFTDLRFELALSILFADERNPRSVAFQIMSIRSHLHDFPQASEPHHIPLVELADKALEFVHSVSMEHLAAQDLCGYRTGFEQFADSLAQQLYVLTDQIAARYFHHLVAPRLTASF